MGPRILIADDHEIVREGLRNLLSQTRPGWTVCGQAANGEEAIASVEKLHPDAIILDITMPVMNGLEAAARIAKLDSHCRILIFTMHDSERLSSDIRDAGAQGFVLKSQAGIYLITALETLLGGGMFFGTRDAS